MPLSVDLEADLDQLCAEHLRAWSPLDVSFDADGDVGDGLDLPAESFAEAVDEIAALDGAVRLRALRVVGLAPSSADLQRLLALPGLARIEALLLPNCLVGAVGAAVLAASAPGTLRLLDLRGGGIGDAGAVALADGPIGGHLEHLSVARCGLTARGLERLLASPVGRRAASLHVDEEQPPGDSLVPTIMEVLYRASSGDARDAEASFEALLATPALTDESREELRYQWNLVMSA